MKIKPVSYYAPKKYEDVNNNSIQANRECLSVLFERTFRGCIIIPNLEAAINLAALEKQYRMILSRLINTANIVEIVYLYV